MRRRRRGRRSRPAIRSRRPTTRPADRSRHGPPRPTASPAVAPGTVPRRRPRVQPLAVVDRRRSRCRRPRRPMRARRGTLAADCRGPRRPRPPPTPSIQQRPLPSAADRPATVRRGSVDAVHLDRGQLVRPRLTGVEPVEPQLATASRRPRRVSRRRRRSTVRRTAPPDWSALGRSCSPSPSIATGARAREYRGASRLGRVESHGAGCRVGSSARAGPARGGRRAVSRRARAVGSGDRGDHDRRGRRRRRRSGAGRRIVGTPRRGRRVDARQVPGREARRRELLSRALGRRSLIAPPPGRSGRRCSGCRARRAASARLAWDFTVPTEMPSTSAVSASVSCS